MNDWSGEDRRASKVTLQDILLEVMEVKNEVKHINQTLSTHTNDDKENFNSIRKDVTFLQRCAFGLFGAWAFFQLLISSGALNFSRDASAPNSDSSYFGGDAGHHVGRYKDSTGESGLARGSGNPTKQGG